ncbi:hypothetical protein BXY41_12149 [Lacrimispora xylanisolvens]|uniref:Uncharacterized protein n=1 Tax=Lacrimispora xylanisolvens TaxID=384636 RepID=A0A2S6HCL3_9FIRM|nr:hypothetical protein [Hungatella xylanolytica]MBE5988706.1 hypothetical protein [Paenibacillaceae bacterium]PPK75143.1 hypothetical protein BXY41_12149 [Hungatella xylanolytica]
MIYHKSEYIKQNCNMKSINFIVRLNLIQAPLEAAISLFVIEGVLIYSNLFSQSNFDTNVILIMIFFPILISLLIYLLYSIFINGYLLKSIYECACYIKNVNYLKYEIVDNYMKKTSAIIHFVGLISYMLVSVFCAYIFTYFLRYYGMNNSYYIAIIVATGCLIGALWNILGYWGDNKIDWSLVFNDLETINQSLKEKKYNYMIKHFIMDIFMLLLFCTIILITLIYIKDDYKKIEEFNLNSYNLASHSFFIISYFTLLVTYIKKLYKMYFKEGAEVVYSSYEKFF